jgi:hypothetical protein
VLQHSGIQAGRSLVHENPEVNIQKNSPKNIPKRKRTRDVFCMVESNFLQTKIAFRNLIIII